MRFTDDDVTAMSLGAAVLGGGGAGDPYLAEVMLRDILGRRGAVEIISLDELAEEDHVVPLALMGSPHAIAEKLLGIADVHILFSRNALRTREPDAVMPYELAGLNALYPLAAAAELGVPLLDADFVGRGFPSLDTTMLAIDGAQPESHIICDPRGRTVTLTTAGSLSMETLMRPIVETMGWLGAISTSSLSREFCRTHALAGTVTRCLDLGRMFGSFPTMDDVEVRAALATAGGVLLGSGRVIERVSHPDKLGPRASIAIESDDAGDSLLRVEQRNEFHVVARDGNVLASVPDLLVLVDRYTWEPLSTEDVATEREVHVICLPAHPRWHADKALAIAGPRAFGYGIDYVNFADVELREQR